MTHERLELGRRGEETAVDFLRAQKYRIVARNYRTRLGEIDIIAWDGQTLCFIEVKTRSGPAFGFPWDAIGPRKRRQISKAALCFLKEKKLFQRKARFDCVGIVDGDIRLIRNAFELDASYSY